MKPLRLSQPVGPFSESMISGMQFRELPTVRALANLSLAVTDLRLPAVRALAELGVAIRLLDLQLSRLVDIHGHRDTAPAAANPFADFRHSFGPMATSVAQLAQALEPYLALPRPDQERDRCRHPLFARKLSTEVAA